MFVDVQLTMAYFGRRRAHVIIGDSRVTEELYKKIHCKNLAKIPFNIEQYKGAGLIEVIEKADIYLKSYPFDVVYIVAGVNDITNKNKATGTISFLWKTEDALANYLIETRRHSYEHLKKDHPGAGIIFCPIIGLDLHRVVQGSTTDSQRIVDNAVWRSNIELNKMRDVFGFCFPFLAAPVHRVENGKHKSYYHHLARDGLHLSEKITDAWATQFVKAFNRN